jgi:hypothetical protein
VPSPTPTPVVLLAAGDIANCENDFDEFTARVLDQEPGLIAALGDTVYQTGSDQNYAECYAPTWGRHKDRTRPAVGNHEYQTEGAAGYFNYFGAAAGERGKGWYSYDYGAWHVVVLNSNCEDEVSCQAESEQAQWLRADLAAHPARCTLAYWHHARFTSFEFKMDGRSAVFWQILYAAGADLVLNGHDHAFERYAPQTPDGALDPARGIRQITVWTGGRSLYPVENLWPNVEVRHNSTYGVLKLTLHAAAYEWEFIGAEGPPFADSGRTDCH